MDEKIVYHEEVWDHPDPVHAGIEWLKDVAKDGWDDHGDGQKRAPSRKALLAHWKKLRELHGPKVASQIWREALFEIMLDHRNGGKYRSWVAGFRSKLNVKSDVAESLRGAGPMPTKDG